MPRLRFSLRTLLIVVALGTIAAWLGPTTVTVLRRNSMRQKIVREGGKFEFFDDSRPEIAESWGSRAPLRFWLGDKWVDAIDLSESTINSDEVSDTFPEHARLSWTMPAEKLTSVGISYSTTWSIDGSGKCSMTSVPADASKSPPAAP
jgi:hypothetical protein